MGLLTIFMILKLISYISCYLHFGGEKVANYDGNHFLMWLG